ncbi:MAG: O-antigen ligase family protein [Coriobacteriia bacterium]|nr:O-antigen ligase family protein [Coriobacteriia bacterium]
MSNAKTNNSRAQGTVGLTSSGKVAWWALIVLVFIVPLAMSNFMFLGFKLSFSADVYDTAKVTILRIGSVIALVAWVYDILKNGGKLRWSPVFFVFAGFLAWATIATLTSIAPFTSFFGKYRRYDGLWSYLIYAILFFLVVQYATNGTRIRMIAKSLVLSSFFVAGYGVLQAFGIEPIMIGSKLFEAGRSFSTYGNPDLLAGFLAFSVFITFGLVLSEKNHLWRAALWIILLMNVLVVITAYSRSIWIGSVVGIVAISVFALRQRVRIKPVDGGFLGGTALAVVALVTKSLTNDSAVTNIGARFASIFQFSEGSSLTRFEIWRAAIDAIKDRPVFGFGLDTFRLVFRRYQPLAYSQDAGYLSVADNVHNSVLQMAAGVGIFGMLLFYATVIWTAAASFKVGFARADDDTTRFNGGKMLYCGFWAACAAYVTHLFFGLSLPGCTFLLFVSMGVLISPLAKEIEIRPSRVAYPVFAVTSILALVVISFSATFYFADSACEKGRAYAAAGDNETALGYCTSAVKLNPYNDQYKSQRLTALGQLAINAAKADPQAQSTKTSIAQAIQAGKDAIDFVPWEYDNYSLLGMLYNQLGDIFGDKSYCKAGADMMGPMVEKTSNALPLRYAYSLSLWGLGQRQAAIAQIKFCVEHDTNFTGAAQILSQFQAATNK